MSQLEFWSTLLQQSLRLPWRVAAPSHDFLPPKRALILQPGGQAEVLFTTALLTALGNAYTQTPFDWAVRAESRSLLQTHPHIHRLLPAGRVGTGLESGQEVHEFIALLRDQGYDTCFIPSRSPLLATIAWQAYIPQRVGLDHRGRGTTHSTAVRYKPNAHPITNKLGLAEALGLGTAHAQMAFYPTDEERGNMVTQLIDQIGWNSERPLFIFNPVSLPATGAVIEEQTQWPIERFALLGNHLSKRYNAYLLLVTPQGLPTAYADKLEGLLSVPTLNLAGQLSIGEIGALCELAQLYVGNDTGLSYLAVTQKCPTVVIHGVSRSVPVALPGRGWQVSHVWEPYTGQFTWDKGADTTAVISAAQGLMDGQKI